MKINQFKKEEFPIIPTRNGLEVKQVAVDFLKSTGIGLVSYGLSNGDVFEFPDTLEDAVITTRQVRKRLQERRSARHGRQERQAG